MDVNNGTIKTLPLHAAISTRDIGLIGAVLDAGANINIRCQQKILVR
jgi:hypothetical protein